MSINYDEKRDFIRMDTDSQITYWEEGSKDTHTGQCINLSASGVLFICSERIEPGTLLHINISPTLQVVPPLDATIEVIRTQMHMSEKFAIAGTIRQINNSMSQAS